MLATTPAASIISLVAIFAMLLPVAFATNGTVLEALGFTSITKSSPFKAFRGLRGLGCSCLGFGA